MDLLRQILARLRNDAALRTAAIYALVAGLWILVSDNLLGFLFSDPATLTRLATLKGWGFVGVTAAMLYGLVRRDLSELKRAEANLRQAQKMESLGLLAGGVAHDFNNLLTAMLGNLNLAQNELARGGDAGAYLDNIEKTVLKASELTRQMLAYSGRGQFQVARQDLNQVVQETTQLLEVSISKKIALRFRLAPELSTFDGDVAQIQQVVMNLVTNASDAIGDAEGTITISTQSKTLDDAYIASTFPTQNLRPGAYVVLEVSDTGCGMNQEVLARIFDPFFTTKKKGRGLGLSAMLGILRSHGAGIKIYTEEGRGSSFKIFFPAHAERGPLPKPIVSESPTRFTGTALLVDDEPVILESTAAIMSTLGFEVITANDGLDALAKFEASQDSIDLVLMDLTMPRMNGDEAFKRMHEIRPELPVILCSGYSEVDIVQEIGRNGPAAFLQKPYLLKDLRQALQVCLPKSGVA